MLAPHRDE